MDISVQDHAKNSWQKDFQGFCWYVFSKQVMQNKWLKWKEGGKRKTSAKTHRQEIRQTSLKLKF